MTTETSEKQTLGGFALGVATWLFLGFGSALWFTVLNGVLVFGPWEFISADAQAQVMKIYPKITYLYIALQGVAIINGTNARNATKEFRMLSEIGVSALPLLVPIGVLFLGGSGSFRMDGLDATIVSDSTAVTCIDLFIFTIMMIRANRRVEERLSDR